MKKARVNVTAPNVSSTDSSMDEPGGNSTSRRKSVLHTEIGGTRAEEETDESPSAKKASPQKTTGKKSSRSRSKSTEERNLPDVDVNGNLFPQDAPVLETNDKATDSQFERAPDVDPFPNESQFNAFESSDGGEVPPDERSNSDSFFCSDEEFKKIFYDKFDEGEEIVDDFDDDFDEDFAQLDDMEFNESLDDGYDEGNDPFDLLDEDMDPDTDSPDEEDFDNYNSDENFIEDADDDYPMN